MDVLEIVAYEFDQSVISQQFQCSSVDLPNTGKE